jgi:hypothetical protein
MSGHHFLASAFCIALVWTGVTRDTRPNVVLDVIDRHAEAAAVSGLAANQTLQTKIKEIVAKMHNPTPAIANDTPTDANVRISVAQASRGKTLIGHPSEDTPHRGQR